MKQKILLVMALLCTVVQGAWADKWDGSSTQRPANNGNDYTITIVNAAQLAFIRDNWDEHTIEGHPGRKKPYDYKEANYHLGACRAYFQIGDGISAARITSFDIDFSDEEQTTGIVTMSDVRSLMSDGWYTLDGRKLDGKPAKKGLYIHNGLKQ